jgi:hypothetical protein
MEDLQRNITIPIDLINGSLTLDEIGTLVVLMSLPHCDNDFGWDTNKTFNKNLKHFIDEEIVVPTGDNSVEIDLTWV